MTAIVATTLEALNFIAPAFCCDVPQTLGGSSASHQKLIGHWSPGSPRHTVSRRSTYDIARAWLATRAFRAYQRSV
jgi:hypothetical protein